jgi:hypothetical protein
VPTLVRSGCVVVESSVCDRTPFEYLAAVAISYEWRGGFSNDEVNVLHRSVRDPRVRRVRVELARSRICSQAREAGCEWLHVDFDDHLRDFYFDACGFKPTNAGLIALSD